MTKLNTLVQTAVAWWVDQMSPSASTEKIEKFKYACSSYIFKESLSPFILTLSYDYTPDEALQSICTDAGLNNRIVFTQKAVMVINFETCTILCSIGNEEQKQLPLLTF